MNNNGKTLNIVLGIAIFLVFIGQIIGQTGGIDFRGIRGTFHFDAYQEISGKKLWTVGPEGYIFYETSKGSKDKSLRVKAQLNAIFFVNSKGWAVGDDGRIFFSSNKGDDWIVQQSDTTEDLYAVHCTDDRHCWAAGARGVILQYLPNQNRWRKVDTKVTKWLYAIEFRNTLSGMAVGERGVVLSTIDGGKNWFERSVLVKVSANAPSNRNDRTDLRYVHYESARRALVGGRSGVAFTDDGGRRWAISYYPSGIVTGIVRVTSGKLVAVSKVLHNLEQTNLESLDHGKTWRAFKPRRKRSGQSQT